jgi:hypothetical protein
MKAGLALTAIGAFERAPSAGSTSSADVAVVFLKTTDDTVIAPGAGAIALVALLAFWLVYPLWHRARFSE